MFGLGLKDEARNHLGLCWVRQINACGAPADLAQDAVMGDRLPHGLRRSSHWRECYGWAWLGVNYYCTRRH